MFNFVWLYDQHYINIWIRKVRFRNKEQILFLVEGPEQINLM